MGYEKTGREYERKDLLIETVYELATPATKSSGKATKPSGKVAGKNIKVPVSVGDVSDLAQVALLEILSAAGGSITKQKVSMKTLTTPSLKGNPNRDAVRKFLCDGDDNLEALSEAGVIVYDKESGEIAVAE